MMAKNVSKMSIFHIVMMTNKDSWGKLQSNDINNHSKRGVLNSSNIKIDIADLTEEKKIVK